VALLGWLLLRRPLTALTRWFRRQPGFSSFFADRESSVSAPALGGGVGSRSWSATVTSLVHGPWLPRLLL